MQLHPGTQTGVRREENRAAFAPGSTPMPNAKALNLEDLILFRENAVRAISSHR
jgi:hypothetical protein